MSAGTRLLATASSMRRTLTATCCSSLGPRGEDAQIPAGDRSRGSHGFGTYWLKANGGEGIYGTRPWTRAQGTTEQMASKCGS